MFTTTPSNYGSLYSEQLYVFNNGNAQDCTITIKDAESGATLGVKKFYDTVEASINISPIVRPYAIPSLERSTSGFVTTSNEGSIRVVLVADDGTQSDERLFILSREDQLADSQFTTIASERTISLGDCERLCFSVSDRSEMVAEVRNMILVGDTPSPVNTYTYYYNIESTTPMVNFILQARDTRFDTSTASIPLDSVVMRIKCDSEIVHEINYTVIDPAQNATRLAWISHSGSIEHYTFPHIEQRMVDELGEETLALVSAPESYSMRCAIAQMVSSPRVWIDSGDEYKQVTLLTNPIEVTPSERITTVRVSIKY